MNWSRFLQGVMPGLVPGIHDLFWRKDVDGRDKPGHDGDKKQRRLLPSQAGAPTVTASRPRRSGFVVAACATLLLAFLLTGGVWIVSLGPAPLGKDLDYSTIVVDREGRLLRPYATQAGRWRLPSNVDEIDPRLIKLLYAYEDKRFESHHGVDPLATLRAAFLWVKHGRIVSGGSTLTMQVARLLEPRTERSLLAKARQMVRAVQLERALTKKEILTLYFDLAPYGGNLEGVRAASLAYFGKEPKRLSLGEAALLVALPQSPEWRRPDRAHAAARAARERVLDRMLTSGLFPADEIAAARAESVPDSRTAMPALAPHAADRALAAAPAQRIHALTIDAHLQKRFEKLARERAQAIGPEISIGIIAIDHASGEILARIGSADYFSERRAGSVDMTLALRSPGSTLKPFIYGLGFEDGLVHPDTLIEDRPVRFGNYAPENFDLTFQGTVTVRRALQMSLNTPVISILEKVGASRLTTRLATAGGALVLPKGEAPSLAMGLGGVGVSLSDLSMLYAGLARLGTTSPLIERVDQRTRARPPLRLLDPAAAWYVGHVLLGTPPPENAAANRIAFKTGTSYGYRDAWSVGFDGRMTIGVWVGRPDGTPVPSLLGRTAAAPILFEAFALSGETLAPLPRAPKGVIHAPTGGLPPPLQRFRADPLAEAGQRSLRIIFPPHGARLELAEEGGRPEPLAVKIAGGHEPLTVLANGMPLPTAGAKRVIFYNPAGPGFVRLTVTDAKGAVDSVVVRLQ